MGNSTKANGCQHGGTSADAGNGVLAKVPGEFVARAMQSLPAPTRTGIQQAETEIDTPLVGRVRLFLEVKIAKRGKHSHCYWSAYRAESCQPDADTALPTPG